MMKHCDEGSHDETLLNMFAEGSLLRGNQLTNHN